MKDDTLFWALCDMDEALILEAKEEPVMSKKTGRPLRVMLIAAAITVLLAGAAFAVYQYTRSTESLAARWETFGETEMPEEQKDYIESKSAAVGESVTDQGVTITLDSVTATDKTVFTLFHVTADPDRYDMANNHGMAPYGMVPDRGVWVENDAFGRVYATSGGGGGDTRNENDFWYHFTFAFDQLPSDARLNDGSTSMCIRIHQVIRQDTIEGATTGAQAVEGDWSFDFPLPSSTTPAALGSDQALSFSTGVVLDVKDIVLSEAGVEFVAVTSNQNYIFVGSGEQAELARMAEPDKFCFTVEAVLRDGTPVPTVDIHMGHDLNSGEDRWSIDWAAPLDPAEIRVLVFSDGTEEIEVPINP